MDLAKIYTASTVVILWIIFEDNPAKADNEDFWWEPVTRMMQNTCSVTSDGTTISNPSRSTKNMGVPKKPPQLILNADVKETIEILTSLQKTAEHWVSGEPKSFRAEKLRCSLVLCVHHRTRENLTNKDTKVLEDLLQIVSFAHYVNVSEKILKGKYTNMKKNHRKLFNKLTRIACKLRQALSKSPLDYVIRDDVPTDLRHMKKDPWNDVVLYLVYERLEEYLKRLPGTYKRLRKIKN